MCDATARPIPASKRSTRSDCCAIGRLALLCLCTMAVACAPSDRIPLRVVLGSRSISKLPFVIAADQGLYEKYGLDVELWMPRPDFDGGVEIRGAAPSRPDITVNGATPMIVNVMTDVQARRD